MPACLHGRQLAPDKAGLGIMRPARGLLNAAVIVEVIESRVGVGL